MTVNDLELLGQFAREKSQDAFTALVERHLNLVYSAALRQVRSPELAEEVSQSVFTNLARDAAKLKPDTVLTAWLYHVTRQAAIDVVRREARRQAREQIALQMSDMNDPAPDWTQIEPLLDEAMHSLDEADRTAILLRYFENKSLREVGEALGSSEDAAQKRISRAVERLRGYLSKRRVIAGASGLAAIVSANAIQAAPSGLAATIASGAVLASATVATTTALVVTKTIIMTTVQKTIATVVVAGALAVGFYQAHQVSTLREQVKAVSAMTNQIQELQRDRDQATTRLAALSEENAALKNRPSEAIKLRGEVGKLKQQNINMGSKSALSKVTANPEARKFMREQQKAAMTMVYKDFVKRLNLTPDQGGKLNDLLADYVMDNVDNVTTVLKDKPTPQQMNDLFSGQEAQLQDKIQSLIGQDGLTQYKEYTQNLLSMVSAEQFKEMLTGDDSAKSEKRKQLYQAIQEETQTALSSAGLPADYQTVPMLNFRNIASEAEGEKSVKLLETIYQAAAQRASAFLSAEELKKFQEFTATGVSNNRMALTMNRTLMAPISQ